MCRVVTLQLWLDLCWNCFATLRKPIWGQLLDFLFSQFTVGALNSFSNRCPVLSRWWCPAFPMSRIHFSPCSKPIVSQSGWWCPAPPCLHFNCLIYTLVANDLSPVRLSGCLQSCSNSFVSQSGWWCRALRTFPIHLFSLLASHLPPIPGLPRRAILSFSELKEVSNITVHLGRFVPGFFHTWRAKRVFGQRPAVVYWAQMAPAKQHCCAQPLLGWLRSFML